METLSDKQIRYAAAYQALLQAAFPDSDYSVGTVYYERIVKPAAMLWADQDMSLDILRNNMSLRQVLSASNPDPVAVDNLLSNFNLTRRSGSAASGLVNIYTNSHATLIIPSGTNIYCGQVLMRPIKTYVASASPSAVSDTAAVSYLLLRQIDASTWVCTITAQTQAASNTVLSAGQSCTSDLGTAVSKVELGSTFVGGSVTETTTELLLRAGASINAQVVTGKDNIRSLLLSSGFGIADVAVFGMGDALQIRDTVNSGGVSTGGRVDVYVSTAPVPILTTVSLPASRQADNSWLLSIPQDYAGAYGVSAVRQGNLYIADIRHILGFVPSSNPLVQSAAQARYSPYQTLAVSFIADTVSGTLEVFDVDILSMPVLSAIQLYLESPEVRAGSFDLLVKGAVPVVVGVSVEVSYRSGDTPPDVASLQQQIADVINRKAMGTEALFSSDVVYACKLLFPAGLVKMPIQLSARLWMPDGTSLYSFDTEGLRVPDSFPTSVSCRNSSFFCYPANVTVKLTEVP